MRSNYQKIKKLCFCDKSVLSQIVLNGTLEKSGFPAICQKILLQIAAKCGAILWVPIPACGFPPKTMIIGLATNQDKVKLLIFLT